MKCMHEGSCFAYVMASRSHSLYVGATGDLVKRVFQHKWKEHEGFAARYNCDRPAWFERRQDVQKAIAREKDLAATGERWTAWTREKTTADSSASRSG